MSLEDFKAAIEPKVQGSWNLHHILPKEMDFFILLSSVCGVCGYRGQANYGIGNTYQDALARYRVSIGQKAVSIDLGMMLSVGFVAENEATKIKMETEGFFMGVTETEFQAMLEHYCNPNLEILNPLTCQVVVGLETPAACRAKGVNEPYWMQGPLFRHFFQMDSTTKTSSDISETTVNIAEQLQNADSISTAASVVSEALVRKISKSLGTPHAELDTSKPAHRYGVDSLVAVELRSWFAKEVGADVAIFDIMGGSSLETLSALGARKSVYFSEVKKAEVC